MIPVIFLRQWTSTGGHFAGLPVALKQARKWNDRVILIGDQRQPDEIKNSVEFHVLEDYSKSRDRFQPLWDRHHGSNKDAWFLRASLLNWLVLADWMEFHQENFVCTVDTDVLLFERIEEIYPHWAQFDLSACNPLGTMQAPTFVSLHAMREFRDYLFDLFEKPNLTLGETQARAECRCCMSAWRRASNCRSLSAGNLCDVVNGAVFDHNLGMQYGFEDDRQGNRILEFEKGQPYGFFGSERRRVRFNALHCWGNWKSRMAELVRRSETSL